MKIKVTQKQVKASHVHTIKVGYCNLQYLLSRRTANYYTVRTEGWASDIYSVGIYAISTGYGPFGDVKPSYDLVRLYDLKAEEILTNFDSYQEQKQALDDLIYEFIQKALEEKMRVKMKIS